MPRMCADTSPGEKKERKKTKVGRPLLRIEGEFATVAHEPELYHRLGPEVPYTLFCRCFCACGRTPAHPSTQPATRFGDTEYVASSGNLMTNMWSGASDALGIALT